MLADEVEKLSDVVALLAVAVRRVGVAGGGDDLEAECRHACKSINTVIVIVGLIRCEGYQPLGSWLGAGLSRL